MDEQPTARDYAGWTGLEPGQGQSWWGKLSAGIGLGRQQCEGGRWRAYDGFMNNLEHAWRGQAATLTP